MQTRPCDEVIRILFKKTMCDREIEIEKVGRERDRWIKQKIVTIHGSSGAPLVLLYPVLLCGGGSKLSAIDTF